MRIVLIAALALAGCGTAQQQRVTVEVPVPIKVTCVEPKNVPTRPAYETERLDLDKAGEGDVVMATTRDWVRSRSYERKLEAIAKGCSTLPKP
jgi:hypothetical protein